MRSTGCSGTPHRQATGTHAQGMSTGSRAANMTRHPDSVQQQKHACVQCIMLVRDQALIHPPS